MTEAMPHPQVRTLLVDRVREAASGHWRTLRGLAMELGSSEASVSARLRDLRKPEHGNHLVERRRSVGTDMLGGAYQYRVGPPQEHHAAAVQHGPTRAQLAARLANVLALCTEAEKAGPHAHLRAGAVRTLAEGGEL